MLFLFSLSCIISAVLSLGLSVFTYFKNRKSILNRSWAVVSLSASLWSLSLWGVVTAASVKQGMNWQYILDAVAIFIPVLYLEFVLALIEKVKKLVRIITWVFSFILLFVSFTGYFKLGVAPALTFNYWIVPGPLYFIFPLFFTTTVVYLIYLLADAYKNSTGIKRNQIKFVLITALIGFSGGATNFLPQLVDVYPVGHFFFVFYIFSVAYAITRYKLMDIRVVLRRYTVYISSLISIILPTLVLKRVLNSTLGITVDWVDYVVLAIAITVFPGIKNYYYRFANKYLFSSLYDSREVIAELSDRLSSTLETKKIFRAVYEVMNNSVHAKTLNILIFNKEEKKYECRYYKGAPDKRLKVFIEDKGFYSEIITKNKPIIVEDLKKSSYVKFRNSLDVLMKNDIEILVPLYLKDETIGLIALGEKESRDIYNTEDIQLLEIIGTQSAIAIDNALHYEEIKSFSEKLAKEVEAATHDLRTANEKLQQLDKAKSEFISIASHQLRTPLTVIKGYISMLNEGNFGKLSRRQMGSLTRVYESNERLIQLVENLLNISRIESGRLQLNARAMHLEELAESVVEELKTTAQRKKTSLKYEKPKKPLPMVLIDDDKLRQSIMNLVDNAIKYTKPGGRVAVKVVLDNKNIKFSVTDSGIGISREDMGNLFKKFSRGKDGSLLNTEGTGLGLYVAKEMIDMNHGKIWAESAGRGKGTTFNFTVPISE